MAACRRNTSCIWSILAIFIVLHFSTHDVIAAAEQPNAAAVPAADQVTFDGGSGDLDLENDPTLGDDEDDINFAVEDEIEQDSKLTYDLDPSQEAFDVVDQFLSLVERYNRDKGNCTPGVDNLTLGEGVITQYGVNRFKQQALVAVNRANFLTLIWKMFSNDSSELNSEYFFYSQVRNLVEGDSHIFAAGNCYDKYEFKDFELFCPFAHRSGENMSAITVKDLSNEYPYLSNKSEFFFIPREKATLKLETTYNESLCEYTVTF